MEGELKLTVNAAKSRVDRLARCVFFGCRIERRQIRWSEAAVAGLFGALPAGRAPVLLTLRCAPGHACGVTISALPRSVRAEVRRLTGRTWGVSMAHRLGSLGR